MTAKEFISMSMDTKVSVREKSTGKHIKDHNECADREVVNFYAKAHNFGNPKRLQTEVVIFVK